MKETSLKVLLLLYPTTTYTPTMRYTDLAWLLPEISPAGRRSLVAQLKTKKLLAIEKLGTRTSFRLTSYGQAAAEAAFPALLRLKGNWQGQWTVLVFRKAPSHDRQFRYLRSVLVEQTAQAISRGVYMYPGQLPQSLQELFFNLYQDSVLVLEAGQVVFGDLRSMIIDTYVLQDIAEAYSGISKELDSLLDPKNKVNTLDQQLKQPMFLVFERFFATLCKDSGLTSFYFPESPRVDSLLSRFQLAVR